MIPGEPGHGPRTTEHIAALCGPVRALQFFIEKAGSKGLNWDASANTSPIHALSANFGKEKIANLDEKALVAFILKKTPNYVLATRSASGGYPFLNTRNPSLKSEIVNRCTALDNGAADGSPVVWNQIVYELVKGVMPHT